MDKTIPYSEIKKHFRNKLFFLAVVYVLIGLFLIINPEFSFGVVLTFGSIILIVFAVAQVIDYFLSKEEAKTYGKHFVLALVAVALAVFLVQETELVWQLLGLIAGVCFFAQAGYHIHLLINQLNHKRSLWWLTAIFILVFLGFGIYALITPGGLTSSFVIATGVMFIVSAVMDVVSIVFLGKDKSNQVEN